MFDPPRARSWFHFQFSLGTMLWLMLVVGMAMAWWLDRRTFDQRLQKLEQMYAPTTQQQNYWSAANVLGAPDDPAGTSGQSWCQSPAHGADWVEVGFDRAVAATTIDLYETYSIGCVKEVLVIDSAGNATSIWQGTDPTPAPATTGLFKVPVPKSIRSVHRVKIHVDSTGKGPWACLDAVGLTNAAGKTTWATSSECSSVYGNSSLTATSKKSMWQRLW